MPIYPPPSAPPPAPAQKKSAFNKQFVQKKWFIRREKDILKVFRDYRERVKHAVLWRRYQQKIDLVIKVRMSRQDKEGEYQEVSQAFCGGARLISRAEDFDEVYDESVKKIWSDFDQ